MRYQLEIPIEFEACHQLSDLLPGHKCANKHGHSYAGKIVLEGTSLENGFLLDSAMLTSAVEASLDHADLNQAMAPRNPTLEHTCLHVAEIATQIILHVGAHEDVIVREVELQEGRGLKARVIIHE